MNVTQNRSLKCLFNCFNPNDVVIVSGKKLGLECFNYNRDGVFYVDNIHGFALPFSLGIAMCTTKRVFTLMTDSDFIYSISAAAQVGVSKCKNIFFIVLCTGRYNEYNNQPNIFGDIKAIKGVLFNMGLLVQDYTSYIRGTNSIKSFKNVVDRARGPMVSIVKIDKWVNSKNNDSAVCSVDELHNFVNNEDIGTSMFTAPVNI